MPERRVASLSAVSSVLRQRFVRRPDILVHQRFMSFWKYRDTIANRSIDGWKFFFLRFSGHLATLLLVAALDLVR